MKLGNIAIAILAIQCGSAVVKSAYRYGRHVQWIEDHWESEDEMWAMIDRVHEKAEKLAQVIMDE